MTVPETRVPPAELRELFLFERLDDDQLAWVCEHGDVVDVPAGHELTTEGDHAECFFVLLRGGLVMYRRVGNEEVEIVRSDHRGAYCGAVQFYVGDQIDQVYGATVRTTTESTFLALRAREFEAVFRDWFPMAVHLLQGLFLGQRNMSSVIGQRERLLALGKLSAGLTHELNNPAAAAGRAAHDLRDRITHMRHKLAMIADG